MYPYSYMFTYKSMYPYIDRQVTDEIVPTKETINDRWSLVKDEKDFAIVKSDIGLTRQVNEDFYGVFFHPQNKNLILATLADGMGGYKYGEKASAFAVAEISKAFKQSSEKDINDSENYQNYLNDKIKEINKNLKFGGTTLTGAIINENDIITFNIGDSRTYGYNDKLTQLTEDDSYLWPLYKTGKIYKDDIRFIEGNNVMSEALDGLNLPINPKYKIVKKDKYDALLLTSDGIHDILSDEQMEAIIKNNFFTPQNIVYRLVYESLNYEEEISDEALERIENISGIPIYKTTPGKDNSTAVLVLTKNMKK